MKDIIKDYLSTRFVLDGIKIDLYFNEYNSDMSDYINKVGYNNYTILTVYNPYPYVNEDDVNLKLHENLIGYINIGGYHYIEAIGYSQDNEYQEKHLVVFDLPIDVAINLGGKYNQLAIGYGNKESLKLVILKNY